MGNRCGTVHPESNDGVKSQGNRRILLLHFNDVYNVDGSATRFAWKVKSFEKDNPLVLFSGDCFNPSIMSTVTRGKHMVPVLNALKVHTSCLGNHDLDFGVETFVNLVGQCNFKWLVANVIDKQTGKPLGGLEATRLFDWNGVKIGLMGLVEQEWLSTLSIVDESEILYTDFVSEGRRLSEELRSKGAELVIALTHMRAPNDVQLLSSVPSIDIVMGGHDHTYRVEYIQPHGNLLVKSGTDFRDLTSLWLEIDEEGHKRYEWERVKIEKNFPEDLEMSGIVTKHLELMAASMDEEIGLSATPLDGRFSHIRTGETNLGNLVADVMRSTFAADIAIINSGTMRSDMIHQAGKLTKRDLLNILPMVDESVVLELTGGDILGVLENSVSQYPKLEGRFLQISGIRFSFDPRKPVGERVLRESVLLADSLEMLDTGRKYTVATKAYLASGKDGYWMLAPARVVVDPENGPLLSTVMRNHFLVLDVLNTWHEQMVGRQDIFVRRFVGKMKLKLKTEECSIGDMMRKSRIAVLHPFEHKYMVCPIVDGRIHCVGAEE